ncbi:hypothetical protein FOA52_005336 [Chlamydomonas sp. UWO 241]|nr:hypothetical protein FOA52_005336 [Chlamydomonas sp. UWO 241]
MCMRFNQFEQRLFEEVGDGGFDASDFELVQQLGSIMVQQGLPGGLSRPTTTVVAYAARFHQMGYRAAITLLKEYLPVARPVALNEMLLLRHLCGPVPRAKYAAVVEQSGPSSPPVVPLLGYFASAPSEGAATLSQDDTVDSVWLVFKWEGLRPLGMLMEQGPPPAAYGLFKAKEVAEEEAWAGRCALLRETAKGLMRALNFCHSADVVHGSLSAGSVLLGRWEDFRPGGSREPLDVRIDSFGFGKWYAGSSAAGRQRGAGESVLFGAQTDDAALAAGKREDLQASALLLAEAFVRCMAPGLEKGLLPPGEREGDVAPAGTLDRAGLQRLLFGVFAEDMGRFREYCVEDPDKYALLVEFLDQDGGAGWELLGALLAGDTSALELERHRFFSPQPVAAGTGAKAGSSGGSSGKGGGLGGLKLPWSK